MPAQPLNDEQKADAKRLREKFHAWQRLQKDRGLPSSQVHAGHELGFNQSAMNQYLLGKIPLNVPALAKISKLLGCAPDDISPSLAEKSRKLAAPRRLDLKTLGWSEEGERANEARSVIEALLETGNLPPGLFDLLQSVVRAVDNKVPVEQLHMVRQMLDTLIEANAGKTAYVPQIESAREAGQLASNRSADDALRNALPEDESRPTRNERSGTRRKAG